MIPAKSTGLHHVGFTVPDIDEAITFFETIFGCVKVFNTGPLDLDDAFMSRRLGARSTSRIRNLAYLRCGNSANIELFEYEGDDGDGGIRRPSQVGAFHLAFQIDDVSAAANRLRERGVELLEGPTYVERGGLTGLTWIYLRSPWGQTIELYSYDQLGYEAGTQERLYRPG